MDIFAGVDGGATHTRTALVDSNGRILGVGRSGPSNYGSVSEIEIREHIEIALDEAFRQAGISQRKLKAIFLGVAGILSSADRNAIRNLVIESNTVSAETVLVDHDIRISLAGGLAGKEGIALIVGTGSSCYGRTYDGSDWMTGGWGHLLDDWGSAYDLARRGVMAVVTAADERVPQTMLTEMLMAELNLESIKEIMPKIYVEGNYGKPMNKSSIAALAPIVSKAATEGDQVANTIIQKGMSELVLMVKTVSDKLQFNSQPVSLILTGGTVNGSPFIKNELHKKLKSCLPNLNIVKPKFSPLVGSVILSLESAGTVIDAEILEELSHKK